MALELVSAGIAPHDIAMFDAAHFPRPKLCGGGITQRGTVWLAARGLVPSGHLETTGLRLSYREQSLDIREPGPQWLVDRKIFDAFLLDRCKALGIDVYEGARLETLQAAGLGWRLGFKQSPSVEATWLVGADGAASAVRRLAGLPPGRMGRLVEGIFVGGDARHRRTRLDFSFDPIGDGIPGYGWIFPCPSRDAGTPLWKIGIMDGLGVAGGSALRRWTQTYAEKNSFRLVDDLSGWPEHYYSRHNVGHRPGLLLVGEAYGIDALLGEGITPALEHAAYAARRLKAALDRGSLTCGGFESGFLRTEAGWNQFFQRFLADRVYGPQGERWLRIVFGGRRLQKLGAGGSVAYGQMARRPLALLGALAADWAASAGSE